MSDTKISALPSASALTGAERLPVSQSNLTRAATTTQIKTFIETDYSASSGSSLVGFLQSGTGAVARTVQTKMRETRSVNDYGAVGDGVTDDTTAIQAAIDATPLGATLLFPSASYLLSGNGLTISNSIYLKGAGAVTDTTSQDGVHELSGTILFYSGTVQAIKLLQVGSTALNGVVFEGIEVKPTVAGASADGILMNPNSNAIIGVTFLHCKVRDFGKSQIKSVTPGDTWGITFDGGSYLNHTTSNNHVLNFSSAGAGGFDIRLSNNVYIQSRAAGFYGLVAGGVRVFGGIVESLGATPGNGISCGAGSSIFGVHIENTGAAGATIGILASGNQSLIFPSQISGYNTAVQLSLVTNSIVFNAGTGSVTQDVLVTGGLGSYAGLIIFSGSGVITDNRRLSDGVDEVTIIGATSYRLPEQVLATGSVILHRTTPAYGVSITINSALGNEFDVTATNNTAFTVANPTNATDGQRITITIRNASGGALGVITWDTLYKMIAFTSPTNGNSCSIDFKYNGTNWVQVSPQSLQIPN